MIDRETDSQDSDESTTCGSFRKGAKLRAAILSCRSLDNFTIKTRVFDHNHFRLMKSTLTIRYPSGAPMYSARPYTSDLGDVKIHIDRKNLVQRCKIEDLYTVPSNGRLDFRADILLIDRGTHVYNINLESLYDFQQSIGYYREIEPEFNYARIYLGDPLPLKLEDDEIDMYFVNITNRWDKSHQFLIQILDHQDGFYHVDLFDSCDRSMIQHIRKKFRDELKKYEYPSEKNTPTTDISLFCEPIESRRRNQRDRYFLNSINKCNHRKFSYTQGALQYFQKKLKNMSRDSGKLYLQKRFFKVKVLCWNDPGSFFIVPDDNEYLDRHEQFKSDLNVIENQTKKAPSRENRFEDGERCLFRNEIDVNLGAWLRGVIIRSPYYSTEGYVAYDKPAIEASYRFFNSEKVIYLVESIDYGFQCLRTPINLLRVQDDRVFEKCPWALKCKLFGVEPHDNTNSASRRFSENCLDRIDSWMREKILNNSRFAFFHVLFRSDITSLPHFWDAQTKPAHITLFHRYEPLIKIGDCIGPRVRRTRYDCLNSFIIDCGLASDTNQETGQRSRVDLDSHVVNLLVLHDKI